MCEDIMTGCKAGWESGAYRTSGVYTVLPSSSPAPFQVYCRMNSKSGRTRVQRQTLGGGENFNRTWAEYRDGFGNVSGDHWLGLTHLHHLTQTNPLPTLNIRIVAMDIIKYRYYFRFTVQDETNLFRFSFQWSETEAEAEYSLGDCLGAQENKPFSTFDNDNDDTATNCPGRRGAGWWFSTCMKCCLNSNITGLPYSEESDVNWIPGLDQGLPITSTEMYIR